MKKNKVEKFILKAKKNYGDKYDYSEIEYINSTTEISILCTEHGEFEQSPAKHLNNQGCYKCGKHSVSKKLKKSIPIIY
jgi:hypothetical protein